MRIKDNSVKLPLGQAMLNAYPAINRSHVSLTGKEAVITSGQDGRHKRGSKHYSGNAVDLRVWYTDDQTAEWAQLLRELLGPDYDVVYGDEGHLDHIHLEYDPK